MRHPTPIRQLPLLLAAALLAFAPAAAAVECTIDGRFASPRAESLIAAPPMGHQAVVTADGGLRFEDGGALSVAPMAPFAFSRRERAAQRLVDGRVPVVVTTREGAKLATELTAFVAASPPTACLRVVVRNKTPAAIRPVLRIQADQAHGRLPGKHVGFQRSGQVFALCELREGKGQVAAAVTPKRYVFRREGGKPLPDWGHPARRCDRGFRNIVAGFAEPATYHLQAKAKTRYVVAVGLCESHWKTPGNRICDILIEGRKVATVDPVKKPHGPDVPFVLTFPATDRDRNGWISVTSVATPGSPDVNSILNVVWLFEERVGKELSPADIVAGRANRQAHCYVDCGGPAEAPGPATLDYQLDLPAKGSATLWLKKPFQGIKAAQATRLAALDGPKLLERATSGWAAALRRGTAVELSGHPAADLLGASLSNLLALRARADGRVALPPGPFSRAVSPGAAAFGAAALDRMGFHAEAAGVLADLAARPGPDGLWHEGGDSACPTGQVLWAFALHYRLTGDKAWLAASYGALFRAAEALTLACDHMRWMAHHPAFHAHGLMPAAPFANLPADYWLARDFWAMNGLRAAAEAAGALGRDNERKWLEGDRADYLACVQRAIAQSHVLGPAAGCFPAVPGEAPHWTFASCVAALYPTRAVPAADKRVAATFRYLDQRSVEGLPGGIDAQSSVVEVPLACQYALARLAAGDADGALAAFTSIANVASPAGAFPERSDLRARRASGLAPSAAAAAGYVLVLRDMLVGEQGGELRLCPCVPRAWLAKALAVARAPTAFGPVSYRATLAPDGGRLVVEATIPTRPAPKAVVIALPRPARPIKAAQATSGKATVAGQTVRVVGWRGAGKVDIQLAK